MFPFFSARRKPGWLAVLPHADRVTLAHVVGATGSRPVVQRLDSFAIENGTEATFRRLRTACQLASHACTTLMGEGEYMLSQLDAPPVPEEERKEALRWSLRDLVTYPVDSACIDVLDIPNNGSSSGRSPGVLVVSAPEAAVRARTAPFESAGIALAAVDIPELAQRNVARLLEDENRGLVFLRLDENGMMLTLTFRGELIAVRRGEMNTQQLTSDDPDVRSRVLERLGLELQRSLDNFDRQYSHIPVSKVVVASDRPVENLAAELANSTYVSVQEMDLSAVLDFEPVPELRDRRVQGRHLLAIGAALRTAESA
ncbi:type IV pilus biogenesis protein PilM [Propionivibrio limicola]|uniref:type IV pilus biogenesis protein PilM n=1 Tax=Propionivibrio limicola TaxID=167645 RepID=UPI0012914BB7|nr:agglutinin biogenesis protein MshI [Propionivibrio limicola]